MLAFLSFLAVLTAFFFVISKHNKSIMYLAVLLLAFLVDILSFMLYLGRDNYYYNVIQNYFGISRQLWNYFIFTPFSQDWIIRMINISSVTFIYFNIVFSGSFLPLKIGRRSRLLRLLAISPVFQIFVYDPFFYKNAYLFLYPTYFSAEAVELFYWVLSKITFALNASYLLLSVSILIYSYAKLKSIKLIKNYMFLIVVSYLSIIATYFLLLSWAPALLIKVSKIAHFTSYLTISLNSNMLIYHIFPYSLIFTLVVITFGIYRYAAYQQHVVTKNHSISTEIDAAAIATSVFSHYIKNQMISIMAQIEDAEDLISKQEEGGMALRSIEENCRNVLDHIDRMHVLVESGRLSLQPLSVEVPIRKALSDLSDPLKDMDVNLQIPSPCPTALIDPDYFTQVLVNIIANGADAMSAAPKQKKRLDIAVEVQSHWIVLTIRDYGAGIAPENIGKIFSPYFTTKNSSKNWGIGLSLCHKIVMAHSGKIGVSSRIGEGTTFTILIPDATCKLPSPHRLNRQKQGKLC